MYENIFIMWIIVWVIFLIMSCIEKRGVVFGVLASIWILFLGIYIIIDGFQLQTGVQIVSVNGTQVVSYTYTDVVMPFSSYGVAWGLPFILLSMYIGYLAVTAQRTKNE